NDTLRGDEGNDLLVGDYGDTKNSSGLPIGGIVPDKQPSGGKGGNDTLYASTGQDGLYGEQGEDTFVFDLNTAGGASGTTIDGGPNRDVVVFQGGDADSSSKPINDDIAVSLVDAKSRTYKISDKFVNWIYDPAGNLSGSEVVQDLGSITYTMPASVEVFRIAGRQGDDRVKVDSTFTQRMEIDGGAGNDTLIGGGGLNTMWGDEGDDLLIGGKATNELHGGDGKDTLLGGAGADALFGETEDDILVGGGGSDFLYGGDGNDFIIGDSNVNYDALIGGKYPGTPPVSKIDLNHLVGIMALYGVTITSDTASDIIYGDDDASGDGIGAAFGNDVIFGSDGDDVIFAGGGNDWVDGRAGLDVIDGGANDDDLYGGGGYDRIFGNDGNDHIDATRWDESAFSPIATQDAGLKIVDIIRSENDLINTLQVTQTRIVGQIEDLSELIAFLEFPQDWAGQLSATTIKNVAARYPLSATTQESTFEQLKDIYGEDFSDLNTHYLTLLTTYGDNLKTEQDAIAKARANLTAELQNLKGLDAKWYDSTKTLPSYIITGGDGNDVIHGSNAKDVIDAGQGNDTIYWSPGDDAIFGGTDPGSGTSDQSKDTFVVQGSAGADTIDVWSNPGESVHVRFSGLDGMGTLLSNTHDKDVTVDHLGIENIEVDALGGDDYVTVATGKDAYLTVYVDGGTGNDYLTDAGSAGRRPG
ncbi:calcium-binding protein, partial [Singulisphaera rosea]